jgi:hypothetical protein
MVTVHLLPLNMLAELTMRLRADNVDVLAYPQQQVVFAASADLSKLFFLHGAYGGVGVRCARGSVRTPPCVGAHPTQGKRWG